MRILKAVCVGVVTGAVCWAISYGLYLWQLRQLQNEIPAGLGAASDEWAGPAALVGFALGFVWQVRREGHRSRGPA